ncbi:uncharacterized protein YcbX [Tenggerimyces flavus]|nr:uncharacterized protein YcbX [Tenggerimyces flavus]
MPMRVVSLRRYPVKSMAGEFLRAATFNHRGIEGDRWYAVEDPDGHFASGKNTRRFRRRDPIFSYGAVTSPSGDVVVTGPSGEWRVGDPALDAELSHEIGLDVRVTSEATIPHQDMGSVSLIGTATLEWCAERWGIRADPRRLRVNLVFSCEEPFIEESWAGRTLVCGGTQLRVVERVPRCRMIDIDQDGAKAEGKWLKPLAAERDMFLAMYADVATSGVIRLGDELAIS